ncbi:MAG: MFS transporter [Polyangiaceae bacterium]|nr:MFS transporter [Polyangiaceae bacterium]
MTLSQRDVNIIVAGSLLAMFLAALDQTVVATALTTIAADLGGLTLVSWVVTAYLVTSTCATLIAGKLSDMHGRRPALLAAIAVFLFGSVLSALAGSMTMLIIARAVQGIGGGAVITIVQASVADVVAPRERGRYSGYYAVVFATSAVCGPIVGAQVTHYAGWPWIFWVNLPLGLAAIAIIDRALRRAPLKRIDAKVDYTAVAQFTVGAVALLLFVSTGGVRLPWTSAPVLVAAAVAAVFGVLFFRRQRRVAEPILPPRFLADAVVAPIYFAMFCVFGCYLAVVVTVPIFFQIALGVPIAELGMLMIPMTLVTSIAAGFAGRYTRVKGRYKPPPLTSLPLAIGALSLLATFAHQATPLTAAALLTLVGIGVGPCFPCSMVAVQNAVMRRDIGAVTGGIVFFRALGGAVITAGASSLLLGLIAVWLPSTESGGGLQDLLRRPLTGTERSLVIDAFAAVFFGIAAGLAAGWLLFARAAERPLRTRDDIVRETEVAS